MIVSVGLMEGLPSLEVELLGTFVDPSGARLGPGRVRLDSETTLSPVDPAAAAFAIDGVTIGIGFHWERKERQAFRGTLRLLRRPSGLTVVNDVPLEEYVTSVVSSEMSAACPPELLKAHAVISRSWLKGPSARAVVPPPPSAPGEVLRWYGREAHPDFEVCADDHCQRYQGITKAISPAAAEAVRATAGEMLLFDGEICDARFSKCCGGLTESYATAWDDAEVPYLVSFADGLEGPPPSDLEAFLRAAPAAFCNTADAGLLARILPGFDQETRDFYRWRVAYGAAELGEIVAARLGVDLGPIVALEPLARGPSGRIFRLRISGERGEVVVGKELEIRRALSRSHLYSSAFVVDRETGPGDEPRFVLRGGGWGHGVGLCQIGAAVMAERGFAYRAILAHYYPGTSVGAVPLPEREIRGPLDLDARSLRLLETHSILNVLNVVVLRIGDVGDLVGDAETADALIARVRAGHPELDEPEKAVAALEKTREVRDAVLAWIAAASEARTGSLRAELDLHAANLASAFDVLAARAAELGRRVPSADPWVRRSLAGLRENLAEAIRAIERNALGRWRIASGAGDRGPDAYLIEIDLSSRDGETLALPAVLEDVMRDLAANARKYTAPGGALRVTLAEDGDGLLLRVSDTGRGIPEEEIEEVVRFGRRGRPDGRRQFGGGYGLTKACYVAHAFGGRIWIRSAPGAGTTVTIRIPRPDR
ncbi:MAG TPA: SpoIID/LytB domain-containing protein [Thermoanaerobaculia bacterium]|nr:SpoIID/LytB domain-containing protein [Thermoanaerobaculia bacterium]